MLAPTFALLALSSLAAAAPFAVTVPGGNPVIIVDATFQALLFLGIQGDVRSGVVARLLRRFRRVCVLVGFQDGFCFFWFFFCIGTSLGCVSLELDVFHPDVDLQCSDQHMKGMVKLTGAFSGDLGYVFNDINTYTGFATVSYPNATEAQIVTLPASSCGSLVAPFEIGAITPNASAYPYMGLSTLSQSASVLDPNANSTAGNYAVILGTLDGPPGALSGTKNNSLSSAPGRGSEYAGGQSSVWSLNCTDMTFTATWIDAKGASVPLGNFYSSTYDGDNGEPYGKPYNGAFNIAEPTKGFFGPGGHPHKVYGPNGGPDNGQIVLVTEALTMTFVPTA
ncbi:hypothetical protein RQP46_003067 [Phenoliferia psychrophenolica]